MAQSSAVTLFDLPLELHLKILSCLDYPTCLALSQANVFFRSIITVEKPSTSAQKVSFLCTAENWPRYKDKFSCSRCLKLCPSGAFSDKQIKAKRGKGHAESDRRFCLKCGVKKRIYQPGEPVIVNRHTHYICALCWKLCGSGLFCLGCRACRRCIERKTIIWASLGVVIRPDKIENTCALCSWHYNNLGVSGPERDATN